MTEWYEHKVAVIGCGVMAQCLVDGWLKNEIFDSKKIILTDNHDPSLVRLSEKYPSCKVMKDNKEAVLCSDVIFICLKPFMVQSVLSSIPIDIFKDKIIISIAAGLKLSLYHTILAGGSVKGIIRAMPNIACKVDHGLTAVCGDSAVDGLKCDQQLLFSTESIFKPLGGWSAIDDEKLMDAVTALNGSALAFGCMAIEAMADGAVSMGLPRSLAISLSSHALLAASALQIGTGDHPAILRDQITTPGGCTIAGLSALEHGNFRSTLIKAVQETTRVSKEMGNCNK